MGFYRADQGSSLIDDREADRAARATPRASASAWSISISRWRRPDGRGEPRHGARRCARGDRLDEGARARSRFITPCRSAFRSTRRRGLAAGEKQKLEILKQLYLGSRFLILDEPTSVLTPQEADEVLGLVSDMAARGDSPRCSSPTSSARCWPSPTT